MKCTQTKLKEGWTLITQTPTRSLDSKVNHLLYLTLRNNPFCRDVSFNPDTGRLDYAIKNRIAVPGFEVHECYYTPLNITLSEPEKIRDKIIRTLRPTDELAEKEISEIFIQYSKLDYRENMKHRCESVSESIQHYLVLYTKIDPSSGREIPYND